MAKARAGWYPHPKMKDTLRYWDGDQWTDQVQPTPYAGVPKRMQPAQLVGTVLALVIVAAVVIGLVFFQDNDGDCVTDAIEQQRSVENC